MDNTLVICLAMFVLFISNVDMSCRPGYLLGLQTDAPKVPNNTEANIRKSTAKAKVNL